MMDIMKRLAYPQLRILRMADTKIGNNHLHDRDRWKAAGPLSPLMPF